MTEKELQLYIDYQETFDNDRGRRILADLRKAFNFDLSVIPKGDDGHIDIYEVLRNEGKRSVVLHILRKVEKDLNEEKQDAAKHEAMI